MSAYSIFYLVCLIISAVGSIIFVIRWTPQIPVHYPLLFMAFPIAQVGYLMQSMSTNLEEALLATKMTYFGGCFIQPLVFFSILSFFNIKLRKMIKIFFYVFGIILYSFVLTIGFNSSFYKDATFELAADGAVVLHKTYGIVHVLFYITIILYMLAGIMILIYAKFSGRKDVSNKNLAYYVAIEAIAVFSFFFTRITHSKLEFITAAYVLTEIFFLIITSYVQLHNIAANAAFLYEEKNTNCFISFDTRLRYIGANAAALKLYPELAEVRIDNKLDLSMSENFVTFDKWLSQLLITKCPSDFDITVGDNFYRVNVNYLKNGSSVIGYCINLEDTTQNRKYAHLLEDYSRKLNEEVSDKTDHIKEMQDKMILTFAEMVENRDSSTGGHIKRTTEGVKFLVSKMRGDRRDADDRFCNALINAAPMHDLGRIAIPDAILQKPGPYESWEYEIMKKHAEKGAEIIHKAFEDYDDADFRLIAENIAHYHHERWDGGGYPMGLSSTDIPLEARIMAIADVYDALVSHRDYREKLSFEDAYNTIMDNMGTQFDPSLAKYFAGCRKELEEFYKQI
ncbi:MAG: HD domain-containing protein [Lachnospiraceae bacterium]|nr:HD domain-containing protein [Lachnospiraceae bacterium]